MILLCLPMALCVESYEPDPEVEPFHKEVAEMMHSFGDASRPNPFVVRMVSGHVREWTSSLLAVAMVRLLACSCVHFNA